MLFSCPGDASEIHSVKRTRAPRQKEEPILYAGGEGGNDTL